MKKRSGGQRAIETHDLRQQRYPLPGTDLGSVNARPMDFVPDVDFAGDRKNETRCTCGHEGCHYDWEEGHPRHMGQHSFAVEKKAKRWEI